VISLFFRLIHQNTTILLLHKSATLLLRSSSEVGFLCRHNAVYSDAILLPARRVGTKRALSNVLLHNNYLTIYAYSAQHGMQQFVRYVVFFSFS